MPIGHAIVLLVIYLDTVDVKILDIQLARRHPDQQVFNAVNILGAGSKYLN